MKVLHTADLHFSINPEKLEEVTRTSDHILTVAAKECPDVILLAGDTVDEYDGRIRLDSEAARAAISFVERAADIAPVVIIRGTKSHDREAPYIFQHLRCNFPIHVASDIEQVALVEHKAEPVFLAADFSSESLTQFKKDLLEASCRSSAITSVVETAPKLQSGFSFMPLQNMIHVSYPNIKAVLTLVPSIDKSYLMTRFEGSIRDGNLQTRELLHDLFAGLGQINASVQGVPRIAMFHGMVTGAQFSSGQTAIGEDLEVGVNDLQQLGCDYVALGHVHKFQAFPGNICYSGSPGRLNFGEQEEKGFLMVEFDGQTLKEIKFHPTPARKFCIREATWNEDGAAGIMAAVADTCSECAGADVRFRFSVPEEEKHTIDRADIERRLLEAGARKVKIECQVIPRTRQRAAGISRIESLPEKIVKWGETVGEEIPPAVLNVAAAIEGHTAEEMLADALKRVDGDSVTVPIDDHKVSIQAACIGFLEKDTSSAVDGHQAGLFHV